MVAKRCGKALQPSHAITAKASRWFDLSQPVVIIGGGDGVSANTSTTVAQAKKAQTHLENRSVIFQR